MYEALSPIYQSVRQGWHHIIHQYKAETVFLQMRPDKSGSDDKCTSCGTLITPTPILKNMTKIWKNLKIYIFLIFMYKSDCNDIGSHLNHTERSMLHNYVILYQICILPPGVQGTLLMYINVQGTLLMYINVASTSLKLSFKCEI